MYYGSSIVGMKDIIIKNMTSKDLRDVYLTYEGLGNHPLKISHIGKGDQVLKTLVVNHLVGSTELKFFYYVNGEKEEMVAYNNLNKEDRRKLVLTISEKDDKLEVDAAIDKNI